MRKSWKLKSKYNYWQFLILFLVVSFSIAIFLINPNSIHSNEFNNSYTHEYDYKELNSLNEQYSFVEYRVDNIPERVLNMKNRGEINQSQMDSILYERNRAKDYFNSYKQEKTVENLQRALFHSQLSYAYAETFPTINCANNVEELSEKYKPLFFYLSYSDKERTLSIISTRERINNFLEWNERYSEDFNITLRKARDSINIEETLDLYKLKCDDFQQYLEEDYHRQEKWLAFKIIALISAILFGIFLNSIFNKLEKKSKKKSNFSERINNFFSPEKVTDKSIERIIKTNSIIAVFGAITIGFMSFNDLFFKILGFFAFIDILIILFSIVLGISALNNGSEKIKKWCYSLYILGILAFIGVVVLFFMTLSLTNIGNTLSESIQTFLNNDTIH